MGTSTRYASWTLAVVLLLAGRAAADVSISVCNDLVPRGETGVLSADLSCNTPYGVQLDTGATLDLNDHTLFFNFHPAWPTAAAVYCATADELRHSRCRVIGRPGGTGAVVGDGNVRFGIFGDKVIVEDVSVSGIRDTPIYGDKALPSSTSPSPTEGSAQSIPPGRCAPRASR